MGVCRDTDLDKDAARLSKEAHERCCNVDNSYWIMRKYLPRHQGSTRSYKAEPPAKLAYFSIIFPSSKSWETFAAAPQRSLFSIFPSQISKSPARRLRTEKNVSVEGFFIDFAQWMFFCKSRWFRDVFSAIQFRNEIHEKHDRKDFRQKREKLIRQQAASMNFINLISLNYPTPKASTSGKFGLMKTFKGSQRNAERSYTNNEWLFSAPECSLLFHLLQWREARIVELEICRAFSLPLRYFDIFVLLNDSKASCSLEKRLLRMF